MLQSTVRIPASARTVSNAVVKSEPRSRIMNLTRSVWSPRSMVRLRALLGGPRAGWVQSHSEDADAPRRVFYYGKDIGLGAVEQVGREEGRARIASA
jgi:hypothetical protein